jgi:hypothetical protein
MDTGATLLQVTGSNVREVDAYAFPYDCWHDRYQEYYHKAFALYLRSIGKKFQLISRTHFPALLKLLRHVRDASQLQSLLGKYSEMLKEHVDRMAWHIGGQYRPYAPLVGEYQFCLDDDRRVTMCIDSHDSPEITSPALLEACDVYVKTHCSRGVGYDKRVVPFFNCNPVVIPYLAKLRAMRKQPPVFDICFIARVWGGKKETEGIEHCMRLLESVAKVRAKKFMLAELVTGDRSEQARRLRSSGVPTTTERVNLKLLWEMTAKSRLNISRLGNHHCMSWRMTDLLVLGACSVLDQHPKAICPVPFLHGQHYYSLDATTSNDEPVAPLDHYTVIPEMLEELLAKPALIEEIKRESARYFDHYLDPIQIGRQLCNTALGNGPVSPHAGRATPSTVSPELAESVCCN